MLAHPHVKKIVSTEIGGTNITIEYYTSPANMSHVESVAVGDFVNSRATLTLNKNLGRTERREIPHRLHS